MTDRRIFPTIHIHPILILFLVIGFITGTFMQMVVILGIVLFHELGHFIMAMSFKWRIKRITLWVFGGVMETDEHGNRPIYEEALVTIAGPLQHVFIYLFIFIFMPLDIMPRSIMDLIIYYNNVILLFNLLPVWPLDGGKCLFTLLSSFIPYKKAHTIMIITSISISIAILFTQMFILPFTLSAVFILLFVLLENRTEWKQRYYVFLRFLSRRFYGGNSAKKIVPIEVSSNTPLFEVFALFMKDKKHIIVVNDGSAKKSSVDERNCLLSYFQKKQYNISVSDVEKIG